MSVVGSIPAGLPTLHVPTFKFEWLREMSGSAVAIALLGLLEALAVAKSLALQTREKLDYNRQCLAEGLANLSGGFFQCMPGSGSLTRSTINFNAGAATRWSGVFSAARDGADRACCSRRLPVIFRRRRWPEFCWSRPPGWSIGRGCDLPCALRGTTRFSCWRRP